MNVVWWSLRGKICEDTHYSLIMACYVINVVVQPGQSTDVT